MIYSILMLFTFFLTGFLASAIGAIPASSSNVAVMTTTLESNLKEGLKIAWGAALGSALLAFLALWFSMLFTDYFEENPWLQVSFLILFFSIGLLILFRNYISIDFKNPLKETWRIGGFSKGALLAFLNPPALIFWVLIIALANEYLFSLSKFSPVFNLLVFFGGIFLGKFTTLYYYGKLSAKIKNKREQNHTVLYTVIGSALVVGAVVQGIRMMV